MTLIFLDMLLFFGVGYALHSIFFRIESRYQPNRSVEMLYESALYTVIASVIVVLGIYFMYNDSLYWAIPLFSGRLFGILFIDIPKIRALSEQQENV
jgi:hypothetical protein